jgi:two-component system OmpR family sensor kinase
MPFLILIPILLVLVANLVRKIFRPILTLSAEIDKRTETQLFPIETSHLPVEVRPFVVAINRLLVRIDQSMDKQRRFVADAAHELRSPLTALSLQAERLGQADMSALARERLTTLHKGILRGRHLLDQLLTLATVQATIDQPKSSVSVQGVFRSVLEDFMPIAELKNLDIGVEKMQNIYLWINELDLRTIVKNLVDNAVRYTPDGGRVDLSVFEHDGCTTLKIQDTGPGITTAERQCVFDPFYRTLGSDQIGSGLGLSIVKAITDRIGAQITLGFSDELTASGLRVCVLFFQSNQHGLQ